MSFINTKDATDLQIDYDLVRRMAYFKWENAGRPEGKDWQFWFRAETGYVRSRTWDWESGPFKVGDDFYVEELDGVARKVPKPYEEPPSWFLGTEPGKPLRGDLWRLFNEADQRAKELNPASVPIKSVTVGGPSWWRGEIKIRMNPEEKGALVHEVGHSFFEGSRFHKDRGGGRNDLWGDAFCDAFRYCLETEHLEGSRWLKEMPTKQGGRYEYPARLILRRTGSWDFKGLKALWVGLLARYDGLSDFLDREFGYKMPEP